MNQPTKNKPKRFDKSYVLRLTNNYVRDALERSIKITLDRISEFAEDQEKSREIFETLSILHEERRVLEEFITSHLNHFGVENG